MTETLNYDPTDPDAPEFSEDEQNSLEVAEKLGQEENELLAGKYKNAEDLEEAYLELQKKLGSDDDDDEVEDTYLDEDELDLDEATAAGVNLIQDASEEYYDNNGAISAEISPSFSKYSSEAVVIKSTPSATSSGYSSSSNVVSSTSSSSSEDPNFFCRLMYASSSSSALWYLPAYSSDSSFPSFSATAS